MGINWLSNREVAVTVKDALHFFDDKKYKLVCYCIMSNHIHLVFYKLTGPLSKVMHSLKGFTANEANKILDRTGKIFWQDESFDRYIRNRGELQKIINYCLNNPVKAGLKRDWKEWPHTYLKKGFEKFIYQK